MKQEKIIGKLGLMDWKNVESKALTQIIEARAQLEISLVLFKHAQKYIKELGGLTIEEEDAKAKKLRENDTNPNEPDTE